MSKPLDQSIAILRDALSEAQTTVRAYDTKAQIVGVGYIFALGVIGRVGPQDPTGPTLTTIMIIWLVVILPIMLFGYVLYPTRKTASKMNIRRAEEGQHVLFYEPEGHDTVQEIKDAVQNCDPIDELAYELLKTSKLRELKRARFLRSLFAAGIAFLVMFFGQIYVLAN